MFLGMIVDIQINLEWYIFGGFIFKGYIIDVFFVKEFIIQV